MPMYFYELRDRYFELITTIVPGPASWSYFVPLLLLPLGLLVPPSILSHGQLCAVVLPISVAATIHAWLVLGCNDVISTDCFYTTMFLYIFKDPRKDFKRIIVSDSQHGPKELGRTQANHFNQSERSANSNNAVLEPYPETWICRLIWVVMLLQSRPLHDWMIGVSGHDRRNLRPFQHPKRLMFIIDILSRLLPALIVFLPLSKQLATHDPYFEDPTYSVFGPYGFDGREERIMANIVRKSLPPFILRPMTMAMYTYSLLLGLFLTPMLFLVLLNALSIIPDKWSPHTWPPHFGPFSAITSYGLRGFWGRWWHQQMRHIVSEPGRWLAAKLKLGDFGWQKTAKYMVICVSAFALSGITHSGMVPPKPRLTTVNTYELRLSLAGFFWAQPCGIAVGLFLLEPVLRQTLPSMRLLPPLLRAVWTMVFLCFSSTFLVAPFGQLGYWNIIPSGYFLHKYLR